MNSGDIDTSSSRVVTIDDTSTVQRVGQAAGTSVKSMSRRNWLHVQVVVEAARREQLVVRAALDDLAVLERQHLVGVADGAQAVGDDERGPPVQQLLERVLDQPLGARVDRRGRLVQDQDARVGQRRARDRQQLALARG